MTLQDAFLAGLCMCSLSKQGAKTQLRSVLTELLALSLKQEQSPDEFLSSRLDLYQKYFNENSVEVLYRQNSFARSDMNQPIAATINATNPLPEINNNSIQANCVISREKSERLNQDFKSHEGKRLASDINNSEYQMSLPLKRQKISSSYRKNVLLNPDSQSDDQEELKRHLDIKISSLASDNRSKPINDSLSQIGTSQH